MKVVIALVLRAVRESNPPLCVGSVSPSNTDRPEKIRPRFTAETEYQYIEIVSMWLFRTTGRSRTCVVGSRGQFKAILMAASVVGHTYPNLTPHAVVTHHIGFYLFILVRGQYVGQRLNAALKVILATAAHSVRSCVSRRGVYLPD